MFELEIGKGISKTIFKRYTRFSRIPGRVCRSCEFWLIFCFDVKLNVYVEWHFVNYFILLFLSPHCLIGVRLLLQARSQVLIFGGGHNSLLGGNMFVLLYVKNKLFY